jgi:hypothetical protein
MGCERQMYLNRAFRPIRHESHLESRIHQPLSLFVGLLTEHKPHLPLETT